MALFVIKIVKELAMRADIVLENYKAGTLARYGLDEASLRRINPRLIYCSITGFGQDGPYAPRPGYDALVQAMGGVMSLTGAPDGSPQKVGIPVADLFAGLYGCIGILAAVCPQLRVHHQRPSAAASRSVCSVPGWVARRSAPSPPSGSTRTSARRRRS